jgi:AP-1 complex subunit mu
MEEDNIAVTPCFTDEGINYMHIRHNNLYCKLAQADVDREELIIVLAMSKRNSNAAEIIFFLHRLCSVSCSSLSSGAQLISRY